MDDDLDFLTLLEVFTNFHPQYPFHPPPCSLCLLPPPTPHQPSPPPPYPTRPRLQAQAGINYVTLKPILVSVSRWLRYGKQSKPFFPYCLSWVQVGWCVTVLKKMGIAFEQSTTSNTQVAYGLSEASVPLIGFQGYSSISSSSFFPPVFVSRHTRSRQFLFLVSRGLVEGSNISTDNAYPPLSF